MRSVWSVTPRVTVFLKGREHGRFGGRTCWARRYLTSTGFLLMRGRIRGTPNGNASRKRSRMHFEAKEDFNERSQSLPYRDPRRNYDDLPTEPRPVGRRHRGLDLSWPT